MIYCGPDFSIRDIRVLHPDKSKSAMKLAASQTHLLRRCFGSRTSSIWSCLWKIGVCFMSFKFFHRPIHCMTIYYYQTIPHTKINTTIQLQAPSKIFQAFPLPAWPSSGRPRGYRSWDTRGHPGPRAQKALRTFHRTPAARQNSAALEKKCVFVALLSLRLAAGFWCFWKQQQTLALSWVFFELFQLSDGKEKYLNHKEITMSILISPESV